MIYHYTAALSDGMRTVGIMGLTEACLVES